MRRAGRPRKGRDVRRLVVKLAQENPRWGYTKIRDALRGLGIEIGRTAIADILGEAESSQHRSDGRGEPGRRSSGATSRRCMLATSLPSRRLGAFGVVRHLVYIVIELKSRAVEGVGIPGSGWSSSRGAFWIR